MKVPPKRKGNLGNTEAGQTLKRPLKESPSEKERKSHLFQVEHSVNSSLNESPSEKEGKFLTDWATTTFESPQ